MIKQRMLLIKMKENEGGDDAFRGSKGWFANFKQKIQIYNIK
jgi:hypothetical protein